MTIRGILNPVITYIRDQNTHSTYIHSPIIYLGSVSTADLPTGVAKLNLTSDSTGNFDGLFAVIPDNTKMTLRSNSQVTLTGELVDVATRPSTGLRFSEQAALRWSDVDLDSK